MDKKRKQLSEYLDMDIGEEEFYHVFGRLADIDESFSRDGPLDKSYIKRLDDALKEHPATIAGVRYDSLKALVKYYVYEYKTMMDTEGREGSALIPQNEEELDILLATQYGM